MRKNLTGGNIIKMMSLCNYWTAAVVFMKGIEMLHSYVMRGTNSRCVGARCLYNRGNRPYPHHVGRQNPADFLELLDFIPALVLPRDVDAPMRNQNYNPNYGFEPYWPGGDWVFNTRTTDANVTETDRMCNDKCSPIYEMYGRICGRNKKHDTRTFPNYCVMRNVDCLNRDGWYIAHRGQCRRELPLFYTHPSSLSTPHLAVSNVTEILAGFSSRNWELLGWTTTRRFNFSLSTPNWNG